MDSKSVAYEFRTKSAQSGGLETNGLRDRILPTAPGSRNQDQSVSGETGRKSMTALYKAAADGDTNAGGQRGQCDPTKKVSRMKSDAFV